MQYYEPTCKPYDHLVLAYMSLAFSAKQQHKIVQKFEPMEDQEPPPRFTEDQVERLKGYMRSTTLARTAQNKLTEGMYQKLKERLFVADPLSFSDMPLDKQAGVEYIQDLLAERTYEGNQRKGIDEGWQKHLEGKTLEAVYAAITTKRNKEW